MKRKALIIHSPGTKGTEGYLQGVEKDVINYTTFLRSPLGGAWSESEIELLPSPSYALVRGKLEAMKDIEYTFVVFTGHGYHSDKRKESMICLSENEDMYAVELRMGAIKRTIIVDACRKISKEIQMESFSMKLAAKHENLDPVQCRMYFDKRISECEKGFVVCNACSVDEYSYDSAKTGGYYSSALIEAAEDWYTRSTIDLASKYAIASVPQLHEVAVDSVVRRSAGNQNPDIEKPRTEPYFPFAVMA